MLCVFLPALNFRGNRSPYLWWFYKFVSAFGKGACYVCGDEYFVDPALHLAHGRDDANWKVAHRLGYQIPDVTCLSGLARHDVPSATWSTFENRFRCNPLKALEHFCLDVDDQLGEAFSEAFDHMEATSGVPEVVITCINCATLKMMCDSRGIPLLHVELGPLREPNFTPTAYFDFSGVNGHTEAKTRLQSAKAHLVADEWRSVEALWSLLSTRELAQHKGSDIDLGLALQIEDDSNIVCYANGFSSSSLINEARIGIGDGKIGIPVLVRTHPGSLFEARDRSSSLMVDHSASAIEFILRCRRIHTINSSVAVEAMLLDREVAVFGDCPFACCIDPTTHRTDESALAFFLLNYLVPWNIAFSPEYIRWRLKMPSEDAIREIHLEQLMHEKIKHLEARLRELEAQVSHLEKQDALLSSSFFWRLERSLRSLYRTGINWRSRR